jgi:hypothetical protein
VAQQEQGMAVLLSNETAVQEACCAHAAESLLPYTGGVAVMLFEHLLGADV